MYDPLGNDDWSAWQASRKFQASVREGEDLGGRPHRLREDGQPQEPLPKLPPGHYASTDCVGTDGCKATVEEVRRER